MKNLVPTLVFLLISFGLAAQSIPYHKQEFALSEISQIRENTALNPRTKFSFKILAKYPSNQVQREPGKSGATEYKLKFWLESTDGELIIGPDADPSLTQSFSGFSRSGSDYAQYSFGHTIAFPLGKFKKNGTITVKLMAQAQNSSGSILLDVFSAGNFTLSVPKLIPLDEQKITVDKVSVVNNATKYNSQGILFSFTPTFLYNENELFYAESESNGMAKFYVQFFKPDGSVVETLNFQISEETGNSNSHLYYLTKHDKYNKETGSIFIPYTRFMLPEGEQSVLYSISATSADNQLNWNNLAKGEIRFTMPAMYFARAEVNDITVQTKTYDVAAKNIPILNLFVGKRGTSGKGYPDLFWILNNGPDKLVVTPILSNSFTAVSRQVTFQMLENDVLHLNVYDYDMLSRNDFLGSYTFPKFNGPVAFRKDDIKNNDIVSGQVKLLRKPKPASPFINLSLRQVRENGLSGYRLEGNISETSNPTELKLYLKQTDGTQVPLSKSFNPSPVGSFSYFINAWELPVNAEAGIFIYDREFNLPLGGKTAKSNAYFNSSEDVTITISDLKSEVQKGIHGLLLEISLSYPEGLQDKSACSFAYSCSTTEGIDLNPVLDFHLIKNEPLCSEKICYKRFFIPYSSMGDYAGKVFRAKLNASISAGRQSFTIGKASKSLTAELPLIIPSPTATLSFKIKAKKNQSSITIFSKYNGLEKVADKQSLKSGMLTFSVPLPGEKMYVEDECKIIIRITDTSGNYEDLPLKFTLKEIMNGKSLQIKKTGKFKNLVLKVS